ncbi:MAG: cell division protein ZapA [Aquabacterium sp.]|jgi:cell division protein ZapA|uniref:cell division protein ZapA n=1 Tax=Aquabacterium sp. TaxID=1872578 RepID=UPI0011D7A31A|nr:cell division protein ZapA [Thauera sp.]MBP7502974.1 cell division protein ZapA [Aquabacterium sp.]TXI95763.1 MAG: cell division protein ZapA [Aquabacterium sp.]
MKQIEVSIMGQSYLLGCPDGGEERLREAVSQVDREMCAIRDSGKLKARERIAVLAALNLAYILTDRPAPAATPPAAPTGNADEAQPSPEYLDQLIQRLDQALDSDGHLI